MDGRKLVNDYDYDPQKKYKLDCDCELLWKKMSFVIRQSRTVLQMLQTSQIRETE